MAHASGPCGSLPGSKHLVPAGTKCDDCPEPATVRVQGETDSMGAEFADLCRSCFNAVEADGDDERIGKCDWCGANADTLRHHRDLDEGMSGPVYRVCAACISKENDALQDELEHNLDGHGAYYEVDYESQHSD